MKLNLKYEPLEMTHSGDLMKVWADEEVIRFTNIKERCTITETEEKIGILRESDVFVVYNEGIFAGIIGCPSIDGDRQFGIFYHLCRNSWGKGIGAAATEWLLQYMDQKYKVTTILADVAAENVASEKILKRCGFEFLLTENTVLKGKQTDIHHFQRKSITG